MNLLLLIALALFGASRVDDAKPPFTLSIVPSTSSTEARSITIAEKQPREFYVVLTNVSMESQPVWESWNSWGYQILSFEFTMSDGKKIVVSKRPQNFTRNFPSTFLILPAEYQVYPIRLDKDWDTDPKLSTIAEMAVTVKAIYEVSITSESKRYRVWSGRVESGSYMFTLRRS
ncbi:MAG TPA: hypothetical protein VKD91_10480 [Pyrinomonadaceae bacterium]|nr:hypothetical protein [Pyrinomonadaceae bacterium]